RRCGRHESVSECTNEGGGMTTAAHVGFADELIDAARPRRMLPEPVLRPSRLIIALQVGERAIVRHHDVLIHGGMIEILADQRQLLWRGAPPFPDMRGFDPTSHQ